MKIRNWKIGCAALGVAIGVALAIPVAHTDVGKIAAMQNTEQVGAVALDSPAAIGTLETFAINKTLASPAEQRFEALDVAMASTTTGAAESVVPVDQVVAIQRTASAQITDALALKTDPALALTS